MPATNLINAAARLAALAARVEPDQRASATQDGLDLLAVAAGLKPVGVLGCDDNWGDWPVGAAAVAYELDLGFQPDARWYPARDDRHGSLPDWYVAAVAARRASQNALYVWRDPALEDRVRQACARGRVTVAEEAALLGYPECCVAQHHAQALALEDLNIAAIVRQARDDEARHRLAAAGIVPLPRSPEAWREVEATLAIAPEPDTSINRCAACVADPDGPAGRLGRRYRELARALAYPAPAPAA
jgi:hypothetical protein